MKTMQELIKESIDELGTKISAENKKKQEEILTNILSDGMPLKEALNLTSDFFEYLYSGAYKLYNSGKYHDAELVFIFLTLVDPQSFRFQMGLASSLHMQKKYMDAIGAYGLCNPLKTTDPTPFYHAADCFMKLGDLHRAFQCFDTAVLISGKDPIYAKIAERSMLSMQRLLDQMKEEYKHVQERLTE